MLQLQKDYDANEAGEPTRAAVEYRNETRQQLTASRMMNAE